MMYGAGAYSTTPYMVTPMDSVTDGNADPGISIDNICLETPEAATSISHGAPDSGADIGTAC